MEFLLQTLNTKSEVDRVIKTVEDKVIVLRFGKSQELNTMKCDEILSKTTQKLANMADIYLVDIDKAPTYVQYFDISLFPATVFFFNGQHMKVDYGTPDHTKFIGAFATKQDFIDLVEVIYRGAMKGKLIVNSPIDPQNIPKYELIYNSI